MRGSGVTAARSCLQPLVSASRYLAVHALPGDPLYFVVEAKSRVKEVYAQTCLLLSQQGMQDCELFGLAILSDGEYLFVDLENKLSKYAPKNWRSSHTYGLDSSGRPAFVLYFRVRYYIDTPLLLNDETSRHHYYLQLRDNVIRHGGGVENLNWHHPLHEPVVVTPLLTLAGLALQADLGDYSEERHKPHVGTVGYCKPTDYLPPHMCIESNVLAVLAAQHSDNRGLSREEAELQYIREAILLDAPLNAHLYRLRRSKNEAGPGQIFLAICARGVRVYAEKETPRIFTWNNIGKLCFDRKKFEIRAVDHPDKLTLYSGCDDKSKLLLGLCRDTHQFFMAIAPRVNEAKKREEEERKVLRDCYMYPAQCKLNLTTRGARSNQRISVISSTSSNTTSGIVSDRVHSEDEPDLVLASTECLPRLTGATIHQDTQSSVTSIANANIDEQSRSSSPVSTVDGQFLDIDGVVNVSPITNAKATTNGNATAEESQCSSSCSTVVVANAHINEQSQARRTSATSSLELGYSHTAQNSLVSSETTSFPEVIYNRCKKSEKYSGTDIASETSGVYTLRSSEMQDEGLHNLYSTTNDNNESLATSDMCTLSSVQSATDEASVTSGFYTIHSSHRSETSDVYAEDGEMEDTDPIYSVCKGEEELDNVVSLTQRLSLEQQISNSRSRSNSILSSSSFRGDGSDPSNTGPLLSADELSDLIVGRYPTRKTISNSMDSDCDYVTMPPPPPPPRIDSDRQHIPPLLYSGTYNYPVVRNTPRIPDMDREPPPPPPYNATREEFIPLPPRRTEPPPLPYNLPREKIQIPPPTPPRNDAVTPRDPPPPPPYPEMNEIAQSQTNSSLYSSVIDEIAPRFNVSKSQGYRSMSKLSTPLITPTKTAASVTTAENLTGAPKLPRRIQPPTYPGDKMKPTPVHAPVAALVVGPNNYLDVHATRSGSTILPLITSTQTSTLPPPPMIHPRQPPPPPPNLATVYNSQIAKSQIEQYKQQLYSDVDYVMFPLKDPAVSKQEYIDAKQGSLLAAMAAYPPPPYPSFPSKSSVLYRSTPYLPGSSLFSHSKYASNHNLSTSDVNSGNYAFNSNLSTQHAASTSSLCNAGAHSSGGGHNLRTDVFDHNGEVLLGDKLHMASRARSDDNILKGFDIPSDGIMQSLPQSKRRRLPPPPPPPPHEIQSLEKNQPLPSALSTPSSSSSVKLKSSTSTDSEEEKRDGLLDIRTLREKSRNLDLPLISALCNDRYLLKQTKAFVLPKHSPEKSVPTTFENEKRCNSNSTGMTDKSKYSIGNLSTASLVSPSKRFPSNIRKHSIDMKSNNYS